jgi:hypothetical protein
MAQKATPERSPGGSRKGVERDVTGWKRRKQLVRMKAEQTVRRPFRAANSCNTQIMAELQKIATIY